MTSVLFCRHGGLIRAVTSGQEEVIAEAETDTDENGLDENEVNVSDPENSIVTGVSDQLIELLKSYETGADQNGDPLPQGQPALQPYHGNSDPVGSLTIGWGHYMTESDIRTFQDENGNEVTVELYDRNAVITLEQAEQLLADDIAVREAALNQNLEARGICTNINQQFYDALFSLYYQIPACLSHDDFQSFLDSGHFEPDVYREEIINNFGEYSNHGELGTMKRRADELDIIFNNEYERNDNSDEVNRYGENIWGILTHLREEQ